MKKYLFLGLTLLVASQTGCSMWNSSYINPKSPETPTTPSVDDTEDSESADGGEADDDDWSQVGKEARGRKTLSRNPEKVSWVDKYFITEKTRQIERNLGVY